MVTDSVGSRRGAGKAAHLDDLGTTLLHGRHKAAAEPGLVHNTRDAILDTRAITALNDSKASIRELHSGYILVESE